MCTFMNFQGRPLAAREYVMLVFTASPYVSGYSLSDRVCFSRFLLISFSSKYNHME